MTKAQWLRERAIKIAKWRVDGRTWPEISSRLSTSEMIIGADELRASWPRIGGGLTPEGYLLQQAKVISTGLASAHREQAILQAKLEEERELRILAELKIEALTAELEQAKNDHYAERVMSLGIGVSRKKRGKSW